MSKIKFYIINLVYFALSLAAGVLLLFALIRISINNYWEDDYQRLSLSPQNYFYRYNELIKMTVDNRKDVKTPKVFAKRVASVPMDIFTATIAKDKEIIKLWYTPNFFFKHLIAIKSKIVIFIFLWLVLGMVGYYILLEKILYLPLSALVKGKEYFDATGIFKNLKDILNLNKHQAELSRTFTSVLLQAAKSISSHLDLNQILSRILDIVIEKFPTTSCAITMIDDDGYLRIKAARGLSANFTKSLKLKRGQGFVGECIETKKIIVVQDTDIDSKEETRHIDISENIKSFVHIPIIIENKALGTFNVNSSQKNYFTHDVLSVISTLFEHLSIAIANAKLYERIKDFNRRLETEVSYMTSELLRTNTKLVNKIRELKATTEIFSTIAVSSGGTHDKEVISRSLDKILEILDVDYLAFFTYNCASNTLHREVQIFSHKKITASESPLKISVNDVDVFRSVILSGEPYISESAQDLKLIFMPRDIHVKSLVVLPVLSSGVVTGILLLANKIGGRFDGEDIDFLKLVSLRIGMFIEKQNLEEEVRKLKSELKRQ